MPHHQKDSRAGVEFISEMRAWKGTRAGIAVVRFGGRSRSPDGERVVRGHFGRIGHISWAASASPRRIISVARR